MFKSNHFTLSVPGLILALGTSILIATAPMSAKCDEIIYGSNIYLSTSHGYWLTGNQDSRFSYKEQGQNMRKVRTSKNSLGQPNYQWTILSSMSGKSKKGAVKYGDEVYLADNSGFLVGNRAPFNNLKSFGAMNIYTSDASSKNEKKLAVYYKWKIMSQPLTAAKRVCAKHGKAVQMGDAIFLGCRYGKKSLKPPFDGYSLLTGGRDSGANAFVTLFRTNFERKSQSTYTWKINIAGTSTGSFYSGKTSLGKGYNLFASNARNIICADVCGFSSSNKKVKIFEEYIKIPSNLDYNTGQGSTFKSEKKSVSSVKKLQNSIQTKLGVEGSYAGATASISAGYGEKSVNETNTSFVEYRAVTKPLKVQFKANTQFLVQPKFTEAAQKLKYTTWERNPRAFENFFANYGTHFVKSIVLGAECAMRASISHTANLTEKEIEAGAAASFEFGGAGGGVSAEMKKKNSRFASETKATTRYEARGGIANQIVSGDRIYPSKWEAWLKSVEKPGNLLDVERSLAPITTLVSDPTARKNISHALKNFASKNGVKLDDSPFKPTIQNYKITITLSKFDCIRDSDEGADAGDMFWKFDGAVYNPKKKTLTNSQVIDQRTRNNFIKIDTKTTRNWNDIKGSGISKTWTIRPTERLQFNGFVIDADKGAAGNDDKFGSFSINFDPAVLRTSTGFKNGRILKERHLVNWTNRRKKRYKGYVKIYSYIKIEPLY